MKKIISLFICVLFILTAVSCGKSEGSDGGTSGSSTDKSNSGNTTLDISVKDLLSAAVAGYDSSALPSLKYYYGDAAEDSDNYLDAESAGMLFYDDFSAEVKLLGSLDSYAMAIPSGARVFEIDILKIKSEDDLEATTKLLKDRYNVKNSGEILNYTPEEDPYLKATDIYNLGNYVILLSTTDNSIARGIIKNKLGR